MAQRVRMVRLLLRQVFFQAICMKVDVADIIFSWIS